MATFSDLSTLQKLVYPHDRLTEPTKITDIFGTALPSNKRH